MVFGGIWCEVRHTGCRNLQTVSCRACAPSRRGACSPLRRPVLPHGSAPFLARIYGRFSALFSSRTGTDLDNAARFSRARQRFGGGRKGRNPALRRCATKMGRLVEIGSCRRTACYAREAPFLPLTRPHHGCHRQRKQSRSSIHSRGNRACREGRNEGSSRRSPTSA